MHANVVIVGGGVVGSSIAFHLAEAGERSVIVVERDPSYARASSALSASSIRQQFTTPACMGMSRYGFEFFRAIGERLEVDGERPDIGLVERGYLYLAEQGRTDRLDAALRVQHENHVPVLRLSPDDMAARFPWLNVSDLGLGAFGIEGEGWFDGYSVMQAFRRKARSLGVRYVRDAAIGLAMAGGRVTGVETATAGLIEGDAFVNAAGPHAAEVARWAGFDLPVSAEKRTIFAFRCPDPPRDIPLVVDASGLYVRPEGDGFIAGGPAWPGDEPTGDLDADYDQFEAFTWPTLAHRIPAFESIRMTRAWAGFYEMCLFDHNAVIGWTPGTDNLMMATGFSGHGMQHSPATGRAVAELLTGGGFRTLDLAALSPERLAAGTPIREFNII